MIKSFGRWDRLATASPWQMRQIKRAMELGLGAKSLSEMQILKESLDNDPGFDRLIEQVKTLLA